MSMNLEQVLHMAGGDGETSYAANSTHGKKATFITKLTVEEAIREVYDATIPAESFVFADLGCSSSHNTFLLLSNVIDAIGSHCRRLGRSPPEVLFFLEDLPGNDFGTLFHYSTLFEKKMKERTVEEQVPYNIVGVMGSFYKRLFPTLSVHFFHSCYSVHWLSQVPQALKTSIALNKGNIYISSTSPSSVIDFYCRQFKSDFSTFLKLRCKELVAGGRMLLTFLGRKGLDARSGQFGCLWGLVADALNAMVLQGLLCKEKVDSFNLPFYEPSMQEVREVVRTEESLSLEKHNIFESNWDPFDNDSDGATVDYGKSGENVAKFIIPVLRSMLIEHFGDVIMDDLFSKFASNVAKHLMMDKSKFETFVIVIRKL